MTLSVSHGPVAIFLVPDWGIQSTMAQDCRNSPPGYIGWLASKSNFFVFPDILLQVIHHIQSENLFGNPDWYIKWLGTIDCPYPAWC